MQIVDFYQKLSKILLSVSNISKYVLHFWPLVFIVPYKSTSTVKVDMFVNGEDCALTTADKTAGITFFVISNKLILLIFLFLYFLCLSCRPEGSLRYNVHLQDCRSHGGSRDSSTPHLTIIIGWKPQQKVLWNFDSAQRVQRGGSAHCAAA